jgi:DNA-binding transcriptional ArsR family regulator
MLRGMATNQELARALVELTERVQRLEGSRAPRLPVEPQGDSFITYSGSGPFGDGRVVWQIIREWTDVLGRAPERAARLFSALSNPSRLRIVSELVSGEVNGAVTTAELAKRLDQPSTGQLFHHLKELLAAGVIHQPVRGTYAVRREHVVPLLTLLCAAIDVHLEEPSSGGGEG